MAAPIFTWVEDWGCEIVSDVRNFEINYGDGYVETTGNGINTDLRTLPVIFSARSLAEAQAIYAFLRTQAGVVRFSWTPYGESVAALWTCKDYRRVSFDGSWRITGTFVERVA